jgi:ATP-utilizing enzymes of the PP-loop superfamily
MLSEDLYQLKNFYMENPEAALCFSGGVKSSYLLYMGLHYGARIKAYFVKTAFQQKHELEDAIRFAEKYDVDLSILDNDILSVGKVMKNTANRCYFCKTELISTIKEQAAKDGYEVLIDGTCINDRAECSSRKALSQYSVRSPLYECKISKTKIRMLSRKAGLFTWNKQAVNCLATQIPPGTRISAEDLKVIERAERELLEIGFTDFKVGIIGRTAKLQFSVSQMEAALEKREMIIGRLKPDFDSFFLDLEGRS